MKLLAGSIALSSVIFTAGLVVSGRYSVEVSQNENTQAAWILDSWTGELTFCSPSTGQMSNHIATIRRENPEIQKNNFTDLEILEFLMTGESGHFPGLSPEEIAGRATQITPCLPGR